MGDSGENKTSVISREEYNVKQQLESMRKKVTVELKQDKKKHDNRLDEETRLPKYIAQAPFYAQGNVEKLAHQRAKDQRSSMDEWYQRGVMEQASYKYRKGACENCGAMTHKTKDCVERPRKKGAKVTGKDIKPDEYIRDINLTFEAKRDRWNGYVPEMYDDVVKEYEDYEEARRKEQEENLEKGGRFGDDEFKESEFNQGGAVGQSRDPRTKSTSRDLRIREDTAKYLLNLNDDSARYDAKTHTMRENPNGEDDDVKAYEGDYALKMTGDTMKLLGQNKFFWELIDKEEANINPVANPTAAEIIFKKAIQLKEKMAKQRTEDLEKKYGQNLGQIPQLLSQLGQNDMYMEFTRDGMIKPVKKSQVQGKSKYEEDVYLGDHTSVWGSWWNEELGWGFACCHGTDKYEKKCFGEHGKKNAILREYKMKKAREEQLKEFAKAEKVIENDDEEVEDMEKIERNIQKHIPSTEIQIQKPEIDPENDGEDDYDDQFQEQIQQRIQDEQSKKSTALGGLGVKKAGERRSRERTGKREAKRKDSSDSSGTSQSDSDDSSRSRSRSLKAANKRGIDREGFDKKKLNEAIKKEKEKQARGVKEPKGKYGREKDLYKDLSKEELEAYKLTKKRFDDPMKNLVD